MLFFFKPAVQCLLEAFHSFSEVSGLVANQSKSSLYSGGVHVDVQKTLLQLFGFKKGDFPMRYLGVPLSPKKWNKIECKVRWIKLWRKFIAGQPGTCLLLGVYC